MRFQMHICLMLVIGGLFAFSGQVQAQCSSCNQAAAASVVAQNGAHSVAPIASKVGCGCKQPGCVDGCKPTGPTIPGALPNLPVRTACDSPFGRGHVPALLTPPRSYVPPVGRAVGRPLFGRWPGY